MIDTFHWRKQTDAHQMFQEWRQEHEEGFFINCKTSSFGIVHRVECKHHGDSSWSVENGSDLTRFRKICSLNLSELDDWAKRKGYQIARCKDCQPLDVTDLIVLAAQATDESEFDPEDISDARNRVIGSIVRRQGQPAFRRKLLDIYNGMCAFTGCSVEPVLDAAHILPYRGRKTNHPSNGLLLRTDVHTLFDLGLVAVDTATMTLILSRELPKAMYSDLLDRRIALPKNPALAPSQQALDRHRLRAGLF